MKIATINVVQANPVIYESGILQYKPDRVAVQLAVAQRREEARLKQSRLMKENNSQLLVYKLDGESLPTGIAMKRAPEVSPDHVAQSLKTSIGYFPDSKTATAAMIKAGVPAPTYQSVMKDQLSGEKKNTKASTVESEQKTPRERKALSTELAHGQAEKKPVTASVEEGKTLTPGGRGASSTVSS